MDQRAHPCLTLFKDEDQNTILVLARLSGGSPKHHGLALATFLASKPLTQRATNGKPLGLGFWGLGDLACQSLAHLKMLKVDGSGYSNDITPGEFLIHSIDEVENLKATSSYVYTVSQRTNSGPAKKTSVNLKVEKSRSPSGHECDYEAVFDGTPDRFVSQNQGSDDEEDTRSKELLLHVPPPTPAKTGTATTTSTSTSSSSGKKVAEAKKKAPPPVPMSSPAPMPPKKTTQPKALATAAAAAEHAAAPSTAQMKPAVPAVPAKPQVPATVKVEDKSKAEVVAKENVKPKVEAKVKVDAKRKAEAKPVAVKPVAVKPVAVARAKAAAKVKKQEEESESSDEASDSDEDLAGEANGHGKRKALPAKATPPAAKKAKTAQAPPTKKDQDVSSPNLLATSKDVYAVDKIISMGKDKAGRIHYKVKWTGYPLSEASWVSSANVTKDLVVSFHSSKDKHKIEQL